MVLRAASAAPTPFLCRVPRRTASSPPARRSPARRSGTRCRRRPRGPRRRRDVDVEPARQCGTREPPQLLADLPDSAGVGVTAETVVDDGWVPRAAKRISPRSRSARIRRAAASSRDTSATVDAGGVTSSSCAHRSSGLKRGSPSSSARTSSTASTGRNVTGSSRITSSSTPTVSAGACSNRRAMRVDGESGGSSGGRGLRHGGADERGRRAHSPDRRRTPLSQWRRHPPESTTRYQDEGL